MGNYYTDHDGTVFLVDKYYLERFNPITKNWVFIHKDKEKWEEENRAQNIYVAEISQKQAVKRMQTQILDNLDQKELRKYIELLCQIRKVNWNPMQQREGGVYVLGYPEYPDELFEALEFLGEDTEYHTQMETWPRNLPPTEMDVWQIRTAFTYLQRAERFCDGVIADAVEDGTILKLLLRLEDLLNAHLGKEQHW